MSKLIDKMKTAERERHERTDRERSERERPERTERERITTTRPGAASPQDTREDGSTSRASARRPRWSCAGSRTRAPRPRPRPRA